MPMESPWKLGPDVAAATRKADVQPAGSAWALWPAGWPPRLGYRPLEAICWRDEEVGSDLRTSKEKKGEADLHRLLGVRVRAFDPIDGSEPVERWAGNGDGICGLRDGGFRGAAKAEVRSLGA